GALDARNEVIAVAERLAAPIVKALLGKSVVPDDCPYTTGGVGLLGTKASQDALEGCDTLLIAGSSFPYIEFYPAPGKANAVQIDIDPVRIGLRYPVKVGVVADCRKALEGLLPKLKQNKNQDFLKKARREMKKWDELMRKRSSRQEKPMKPQVVAWELGKRLNDDAIISCDSGTIATWFARYIPVKGQQKHSLSGTLATMANGLPYTIAAQIAYPDRQCVGFVGDGGFTMLMGEFATAVKYQLPIRIVVIKNNTLGQIKWEQMVFLGNPEYGCELNPIDFAGFAQACGGTGFRIEEPSECGRILDKALRTKGPVLIEAVVDPNEPPMPPKVTWDQAEKLAKSLAKGTPNRKEIVLTIASDRVREMV
ncbi:MAG TPA: thiamine pyrophosphate-dependent enzyme, partial [Candidatus Acidoferrales bacterium]|nr:thiamine pyrophosphate-dependent enzyme [Candidatus Acidoferrales bacterium]